MTIEVKVPAMGESITSGIIAAWYVKDGDYVKIDQPLYELETDKITSEGNAAVDGKISLKVETGEEVKIGQVIAVIDESAPMPKESSESKDKGEAEKEPIERAESKFKEKKKEQAGESSETKKEIPLSPAVRRLAAETGIDPTAIQGTGKGERVTKADMLAEVKNKPGKASAEPFLSPTRPPAVLLSPAGGRTSRTKMTPLRRRIAERLVAAQQTAATLTTFNEVDMSAVITLRRKHQEIFLSKYGIKLGFMSLFVKAAVYALKEVPALNAQIDGDEIVQNHYYDIGVAVSTERGLLVPVVRQSDQLSFAEIETQIAEYAAKAHDGKVTVEDLQGGVFTISNGGIFGSMLSTPILNPPQSGILGMHAIKERPVVVAGEIAIRPMMYLALSYDHRLVDGREAVTFLVKVKEAMEDPMRLLLQI